jgi:hypothetical protein
MSEQVKAGYGYQSDDSPRTRSIRFGLNQNVKLAKFEFNPNGGKDGEAQECLDISFSFPEGDTVSQRMFPVTKAFLPAKEGGGEVTVEENPTHPEILKAFANHNAMVVHILSCFRDKEDIKAALSRPFKNYKDFVNTCAGLLPKNFSEIPLDIFAQYEWQPREGQSKTYLTLPRKMAYGPWLCKHVEPAPDDNGQNAEWVAVAKENPVDADKVALWYEDGAENRHPFIKNGWFMRSAFARQQGAETAAATAATAVEGASEWSEDE